MKKRPSHHSHPHAFPSTRLAAASPRRAARARACTARARTARLAAARASAASDARTRLAAPHAGRTAAVLNSANRFEFPLRAPPLRRRLFFWHAVARADERGGTEARAGGVGF